MQFSHRSELLPLLALLINWKLRSVDRERLHNGSFAESFRHVLRSWSTQLDRVLDLSRLESLRRRVGKFEPQSPLWIATDRHGRNDQDRDSTDIRASETEKALSRRNIEDPRIEKPVERSTAGSQIVVADHDRIQLALLSHRTSPRDLTAADPSEDLCGVVSARRIVGMPSSVSTETDVPSVDRSLPALRIRIRPLASQAGNVGRDS